MSYTAKDIVSISQGAAFRSKIGMYLSADRQEAINLALRELIVNVQDEFEVFKPKNPYVLISLDTKERGISIEDNMRGIPVGLRDDGVNSLTAAMLINHSGGKHLEGAYSSSVGINGCGNKIVCHTAKWLKVTVKRDGNIWEQEFRSDDEGAKPTTEVCSKGKVKQDDTGTRIVYKPDPKVYGDCFIDVQKLRLMLQQMSYFTKGLRIILEVDGEKEEFLSQKGLIDGLLNENRISSPFTISVIQEDCSVELALQWVKNRGQIKGYANGLYMPDGGKFITSFKSSLTRTFNNLAGGKFDGEQIRNLLDGFVSVKVKVGQFSNQSKTALANSEAGTATSAAITEALKQFASTRREDFEKVVELLTKVEKAEAAAEKARQKVLEHTREGEAARVKTNLMLGTLRDAKTLGLNSILLVVEGKSAAGSMSVGRDVNKYGILPIRGKSINALANSIEDVLENNEVKAVLQSVGLIYGQKYSPAKLRYGRIAICCDADDKQNCRKMLFR